MGGAVEQRAERIGQGEVAEWSGHKLYPKTNCTMQFDKMKQIVYYIQVRILEISCSTYGYLKMSTSFANFFYSKKLGFINTFTKMV